jgi:hypothetical protein
MPHLRYALAPGRRLGFASGELAPISGELAPISGELAPISGELAPISGELAPISGELAPVSSSLAPISAGEVRISADAIGARLEAAARLERGRYAAYGEHAEVKEAVQVGDIREMLGRFWRDAREILGRCSREMPMQMWRQM